MDVKKLAEELQGSVEAIKATVEESGQKNDVLIENKFKNLSAEFSTKLQEAQDYNAKLAAEQKEIQEKQDQIEAVLQRADGGSNEAETKHAKILADSEEKFNQFLRGQYSFGNGANNEATLYGSKALESKSMSTDVNPDGGYLVRPELVDKVVTRNFETSPMRQVATVLTGSTKSIELLIDDDEADVENNGEGSAASDTDTPELGVLTISAHKYDAEPRVTVEMLEDGYLDLEAWLAKKISNRITRKENTDFVLGSGIGKAKGLLTYDAGTSSYVRGQIEQVASGSSGAVTADGALDLVGSLHEVYQPNATFMMKRTTYTDFMKLKDSDSQYLFGVDFLKNGQLVPTLAGKRVVFADDMPAAAANSLSVAYGDFEEGYAIYDRTGLVMQRDPFTSKSVVKFYTYKRTGGAVTNYQAIKLMKLAA